MKRWLAAGVDVLRVNTRGHDSVSISWGVTGPVRHGAAYEVVDECRRDVKAWLDFLVQRGARRLAILGHSLGAIKAIYSQALEPHPAVQAIIACSGPRLSYSAFMNSEAQPRFFEAVDTARGLVQRGELETLFQANFPFPILITAAGYLDKYGPEERYNLLRYVDQVRAPLLVTYGQSEVERGGVAFAGMPDAVAAKRREGQELRVVTVAGADHNYTGVQPQLSAAIDEWLAGGRRSEAGG